MKYIIWGHKLPLHSHYYYHANLYRSLIYAGEKCLWLMNSTESNDILYRFKNVIVIHAGTDDSKLKEIVGVRYISHNSIHEFKKDSQIKLQVYTRDSEIYHRLSSDNKLISYSESDNTVYAAWGFPDYLERPKSILPQKHDLGNTEFFFGSVWNNSAGQGNFEVIEEYKLHLKKFEIKFIQVKGLHSRLEYLYSSYSKLAICPVGLWQVQKGYIPCRIFRQIAFAGTAITNSRYLSEIFEDVYADDNFERLIEKALQGRNFSNHRYEALKPYYYSKIYSVVSKIFDDL